MSRPTPVAAPPGGVNTPNQSGIDLPAPGDDILAKKPRQLELSTESTSPQAQGSDPASAPRKRPDFSVTGKLLKSRRSKDDPSAPSDAVERSIRQAPCHASLHKSYLYAALRKHISAVEDDWNVMQRIEALDTGEALVHSPNAVLGKNEDGSLIKPIGRLMGVDVRNRVTLDGGASIMAV